jgi:glycosyltransferase involved in cell wall biosynthesis
MTLQNPISLIHTTAGLKSNSGGPARTVTALCEELSTLGVSVEIVTQNFGHPTETNIIPNPDLVQTTLVPAFSFPKLRLVYSPSYASSLIRRCQQRQVQLLHDHGIWLPTSHAAATTARRLGIPLIIHPRGMLEPWSLQYKAWKKQLAWKLYQHRDLQTARAFCATSEQEAENIRTIGLRQPIAIIPNGIHFPPWYDRPLSPKEEYTALFLSRIHPVKGLLELVKAWQQVRPQGWRIIIAGPDEGGHQKQVETAIQQAGLQPFFQFVGSVTGEAKFDLYRSADLFILPTFTENFGVVIAEALACGVPVITTKGTPWQSLVKQQCGWWIDLGVEPLAVAIQEATKLSDEERQAMGKRGRLLVEQNFGWPKIAEQMLSVYEWILGREEQPECVINELNQRKIIK